MWGVITQLLEPSLLPLRMGLGRKLDLKIELGLKPKMLTWDAGVSNGTSLPSHNLPQFVTHKPKPLVKLCVSGVRLSPCLSNSLGITTG